MPSFERLHDSLREYIATGQYEQGYAKGFSRGKTVARRQVVLICALVAIIVVLWARYS